MMLFLTKRVMALGIEVALGCLFTVTRLHVCSD